MIPKNDMIFKQTNMTIKYQELGMHFFEANHHIYNVFKHVLQITEITLWKRFQTLFLFDKTSTHRRFMRCWLMRRSAVKSLALMDHRAMNHVKYITTN